MKKPLSESLPYVVECKSTRPFFEIIAAFNCRQAADGYAAECGEANRSFEYRVSVPIPVIGYASEIERRIVARLVTDLLAAGYTLSVNDGGKEDVLQFATDAEPVFKALASTDQDILYANMGAKRAFVLLVWGNDQDIISDYSTSLEAVLEPINDWIDEELA